MDKGHAIRLIYGTANYVIQHQLRNSESMQDELNGMLEYYLSDNKLDNYQIVQLDNGFLLGEIKDGEVNGFAVRVWYQESIPHSLYIGNWKDSMRNGEGFYILKGGGDCYFGEFRNNEFHGEQSHFVSSDGSVEFVASFINGVIEKVKYCSGPFTFNGKHYDTGSKSRGESDDKNGCWGCLSLGIIILIALGIYSYCSSWLETQRPSSTPQTEINAATATYVCTARQSLKVRTAPSTSASQIGSIMSGEEVEVYEVSNGFARIRFNGDIGYASTKYLKRK